MCPYLKYLDLNSEHRVLKNDKNVSSSVQEVMGTSVDLALSVYWGRHPFNKKNQMFEVVLEHWRIAVKQSVASSVTVSHSGTSKVQTIMQDPRLVLVLLYPSNVSASSIPVRCSREGRATYYAEFVRNSTSTVVRIKLAMTCNTLWTLRVYRVPWSNWRSLANTWSEGDKSPITKINLWHCLFHQVAVLQLEHRVPVLWPRSRLQRACGKPNSTCWTSRLHGVENEVGALLTMGERGERESGYNLVSMTVYSQFRTRILYHMAPITSCNAQSTSFTDSTAKGLIHKISAQ